MLLLRLGRRLLSRLWRRLLLLLILFCAFANHRIAAGPCDQNRERQRCDHEDDRRGCCGLAKQRTGAASAECRLTSSATEGSGPVGALTLLQQHDQTQEDANNNVENR